MSVRGACVNTIALTDRKASAFREATDLTVEERPVPKIRTKKSFGVARIDHIAPKPSDSTSSINIHLSFEEALKLHFSLGQALAKLNSYNRSTAAGRRAAVDLCTFPRLHHMTVVEGVLRHPSDGGPNGRRSPRRRRRQTGQ